MFPGDKRRPGQPPIWSGKALVHLSRFCHTTKPWILFCPRWPRARAAFGFAPRRSARWLVEMGASKSKPMEHAKKACQLVWTASTKISKTFIPTEGATWRLPWSCLLLVPDGTLSRFTPNGRTCGVATKRMRPVRATGVAIGACFISLLDEITSLLEKIDMDRPVTSCYYLVGPRPPVGRVFFLLCVLFRRFFASQLQVFVALHNNKKYLRHSQTANCWGGVGGAGGWGMCSC